MNLILFHVALEVENTRLLLFLLDFNAEHLSSAKFAFRLHSNENAYSLHGRKQEGLKMIGISDYRALNRRFLANEMVANCTDIAQISLSQGEGPRNEFDQSHFRENCHF